MKIEVKIDPAYQEPSVVILTDVMTEEVNDILKKLSESAPQVLSGIRAGSLEVLEQEDLIRAYANQGKVFAVTESGVYQLRLRLYELEERLDKARFVRISNSEIVNLKKVRSFDLGLTGTICVRLADGTVTYVSRRYVSKIKHILGV